MELQELIKCYLCDIEKYILLQVSVAGDSFFTRNRGICTDCFKEADINNKIFLKNKAFIEANIVEAKRGLKMWEEELNKI